MLFCCLVQCLIAGCVVLLGGLVFTGQLQVITVCFSGLPEHCFSADLAGLLGFFFSYLKNRRFVLSVFF